jgi:hypothetical protein
MSKDKTPATPAVRFLREQSVAFTGTPIATSNTAGRGRSPTRPGPMSTP